ncbi:MAG: single-stranded exonuclease associated with Rad50/Mre11 complex [Dactylosporangium sp.]|nr:single-stranded exonuclease associated with Rad50/Mre11 complex [Dactylosporangium sp.]
MRLDVDGWDPGYGASFDGGDGPASASSAQLVDDVEVAASDWRPIEAREDVRPPSTVLLVDGVRRLDAGVWVTGDDGVPHRGLAASYAAGVVRCDLDRGVADVAGAQVRRGLFTSNPSAVDVLAGTVRYTAHQMGRDDQATLTGGVQAQLAALEAAVSGETRSDDDLLVVDGPLRGRQHLPRALGYIKTHRVEYLPTALTAVVTALKATERTPVFQVGTTWQRYAWYLRLPTPSRAPWAGIVRIECSAELLDVDAVALADLSAVTLPRFASTSYKDPRAPQNLVPIAGLERRLRGMLGDARLLYRTLTVAARTLVGTP